MSPAGPSVLDRYWIEGLSLLESTGTDRSSFYWTMRSLPIWSCTEMDMYRYGHYPSNCQSTQMMLKTKQSTRHSIMVPEVNHLTRWKVSLHRMLVLTLKSFLVEQKKHSDYGTVPSRRYSSIVAYGTVKTTMQPRMLSLTPKILTLTLTVSLTG